MTKRMLIAYSMSSTHVQTTLDSLLMLQQHLGYDADFVHVTHDAAPSFDLNEYDVVLNHYCARHCFEGYVSRAFTDALKQFNGLKVLVAQDEYDRTDTLKAAIKDLGFHVVLTCVPQSSLEHVYPRAQFPDVEFITVFTGYVSDALVARARSAKPLAARNIEIGYRGRDIGARYGSLGFDKYEIGRRMKYECDARGIKNDIAVDERSRIYGVAWFDFVEDCKMMLGTESGSNVFDFDGTIEKQFKDLTIRNGHVPPSYAEFLPLLGDREQKIGMGQISPRVFECAALRTPMVLFRGRYSDVIEPGVHYIALEKDFSNLESVLALLSSPSQLNSFADKAFDHLIGSGNFTYPSVCSRLAQRFEARLSRLQRLPAVAGLSYRTPANRVERVLAEPPTRRPGSPADFSVKQFRLAAANLVSSSSGPPRQRVARLMRSLALASLHVPWIRNLWQGIPVAIRNRITGLLSRRIGAVR